MKWKVKRWWRLNQARTLGCLCAVIVEDQVDLLAGRHGRLDRVQEADELLMPVARHVATDHGSSTLTAAKSVSCCCACSRGSWEHLRIWADDRSAGVLSALAARSWRRSDMLGQQVNAPDQPQ